MPSNQPDVLVYRDSSGGAKVSPGALYVRKSVKSIVLIVNGTDEVVGIKFPNRDRKTLNKFGGAVGINITSMNKGTTYYTVTVGNDIAQGNSSPALIIDD